EGGSQHELIDVASGLVLMRGSAASVRQFAVVNAHDIIETENVCKAPQPGMGKKLLQYGVLTLRTFPYRAAMTGLIYGEERGFATITRCITERVSWRSWFRRTSMTCGFGATNASTRVGRISRFLCLMRTSTCSTAR